MSILMQSMLVKVKFGKDTYYKCPNARLLLAEKYVDEVTRIGTKCAGLVDRACCSIDKYTALA